MILEATIFSYHYYEYLLSALFRNGYDAGNRHFSGRHLPTAITTMPALIHGRLKLRRPRLIAPQLGREPTPSLRLCLP